MDVPALSVVIPTRNEVDYLEGLLRSLAGQRGLPLEVVVADGESDDGTVEVVRACARDLPVPVTVVTAPAGRGRQLNAGARASVAPELLFLHADSELDAPDALVGAFPALEDERRRKGTQRVAGHFGVRFGRTHQAESFGYYYFEAKTHLNRRGCINGDQGFWLSRAFFEELGGFDERLFILEDSRLAERVFQLGGWITLPGGLTTSARRFEVEGLWERHTLNALIRTFEALGRECFFHEAVDLYRRHDETATLDLLPFFHLSHRHMVEGGLARSWYNAGSYTRTQAWQVAFAMDCWRAYRRGIPSGQGVTPLLEAFDRWFDRVTDNPGGRSAAGLLAASWFYGTLAWLRFRGS